MNEKLKRKVETGRGRRIIRASVLEEFSGVIESITGRAVVAVGGVTKGDEDEIKRKKS